MRSHRGGFSSRAFQAANVRPYIRIDTKFALSSSEINMTTGFRPTKPIQEKYHAPEQEIA